MSKGNSALFAIAVCCLLIITAIIAYDFVQKQQAIESLTPEPTYSAYDHCINQQETSVIQAMSDCERYK